MTIFEAYNKAKKQLEKAGVEDYIFEAKQIIKHITGKDNNAILTDYMQPLTKFQENNFIALLHQREVHYPLQYIFGTWEFYGNRFYVGPGVLIPRADTEILVEAGIEALKDAENPKILDLCAGSGCIGISLGKVVKNSSVYLLEKYKEAMAYAEKNIALNETENVKTFLGDIFGGDLNNEKYDLIISNPPYIAEDERKYLSKEVAFEPETALFAKNDGLEFYEAIVKNYKDSLNENGVMAFEVGFKQSDAVINIFKENGFSKIETRKDLNSITRVVFAQKI